MISKYPQAAERAFGFAGLRGDPVHTWDAGGGEGVTLFDRSARLHANTWISWESEVPGQLTPIARVREEVEFVHSWHWFHRFVMASRTQFTFGIAAPLTHPDLAGYRQAQWDMARLRLRNLLSSEVPDITLPDSSQLSLTYQGNANGAGPATGPSPRRARIGDVFTSERAAAMLLRWHVNRPSDVVSSGRAARAIQGIIKAVAVAHPDLISPTKQQTNLWQDPVEAALIGAIIDYLSAKAAAATAPNEKSRWKNLVSTTTTVRDWPNYPGRDNLRFELTATSSDPDLSALAAVLSASRSSFHLYDTGVEFPNPLPGPKKKSGGQNPKPKTHSPHRFGATFLMDEPDNLHQRAVRAVALTLDAPFSDLTMKPDDSTDDSVHVAPDAVVGLLIPVLNSKTVPDSAVTPVDEPDVDLVVFGDPDSPFNNGVDTVEITDFSAFAGLWDLDLSGILHLPAGLKLDAVIQFDGTNLTVNLRLGASNLPAGFSLQWGFTANGADTIPTPWGQFELSFGESRLGFLASLFFDGRADVLLTLRAFGVPVDGTVPVTAKLRLDLTIPDWSFHPDFAAGFHGRIDTDLGSPLARLAVTLPDAKVAWNPDSQGLNLTLDDPSANITARLALDLFDTLEAGRVANNVWKGTAHSDDTDGMLLGVSNTFGLGTSHSGPAHAAVPAPIWSWAAGGFSPTVDFFTKFFAGVTSDKLIVNQARTLESLAGKVLGANDRYRCEFDKPTGTRGLLFSSSNGSEYKLAIPLAVRIIGKQGGTDKTIFQAEGAFAFSVGTPVNNVFALTAESFRCINESTVWVIGTDNAADGTKEAFSRFGPVLSLHIPHAAIQT